MKIKQFIICLTTILLLAGCSKDNNNDPSSPGNGGTTFPKGYSPGVLFIKQGREGILKFDLSSGIYTNVLPNWIGVGWDISWEGSKGVKQTNPSSYDTRYIIFNTQNGSTIKEVRYEPSDDDGGLPYFSPDGTKLALRPTFDDGLVVLDMNGNVLRNISGYGTTHNFKYLDPICWEAAEPFFLKKMVAYGVLLPIFRERPRYVTFHLMTGMVRLMQALMERRSPSPPETISG